MGGNDVGLDSGGGSRGASFGGLGMRAIFSLSVWCTIRLNRSLGQEMASLLRASCDACSGIQAQGLEPDQGGRLAGPRGLRPGTEPRQSWSRRSGEGSREVL
jgi:hypothetical protein